MLQKLFFLLAVLTHPVFYCVYAFIIIQNAESDAASGIFSPYIFIAVSILLPALILLIKKPRISITNPDLFERRFLFALFAGVYGLMSLLALFLFPQPAISFLLSMTFLCLLFNKASRQYKWSWHAMAWGSVAALTLGFGLRQTLIGSAMLTLAILVPLLRYMQKAHSPKELIIGFVLGLGITFIVLLCSYLVSGFA